MRYPRTQEGPADQGPKCFSTKHHAGGHEIDATEPSRAKLSQLAANHKAVVRPSHEDPLFKLKRVIRSSNVFSSQDTIGMVILVLRMFRHAVPAKVEPQHADTGQLCSLILLLPAQLALRPTQDEGDRLALWVAVLENREV